MENTIQRFTRHVQQELNLTDDRCEVVAYGLNVFFTTVFGFVAIAFIGWVLGVFSLAMAAALTTSSLRIVSGGAHSRCLRNCVLLGAIVSPGIGLISKFSSHLISPGLMYALITTIWLYGLGNIYRYAPADTPNKPITRDTARRRYRKLSFTVMSVWLVLVVGSLLSGIVNFLSNEIILASTLGLLWQVFSISPRGYKAVEQFDSLIP